MMLDLDITALLQPLPGDAPCGVSLIHDLEYDAIRAARRADDPSLPSGIWQTALKVADWQAVEHGCRNVLATRSKDLTIAAWLGEAWLDPRNEGKPWFLDVTASGEREQAARRWLDHCPPCPVNTVFSSTNEIGLPNGSLA